MNNLKLIVFFIGVASFLGGAMSTLILYTLFDRKTIQKFFLFIQSQNHKIMSNQHELAQQLTGLSTQLGKAKAEINAKLAELQTAVENAKDVSPEVLEAVANLTQATQSLDDIVPDPAPPTTETGTQG